MLNVDINDALADFSAEWHETNLFHLGKDQAYAASTVGAWLLLAQMLGAGWKNFNEEDTLKATQVLKMPPHEAFVASSYLLNNLPTHLHSATKAWVTEQYPLTTPAQLGWAGELDDSDSGSSIEVNAKINNLKSELDNWVKEKSLGILEQFNLEINEETLIVAANIIATKIDWDTPFDSISNTESIWESKELLRTKKEHHIFFAEDPVHGAKYVIVNNHQDSLYVSAVLPLNEDTPDDQVLRFTESYVRRPDMISLLQNESVADSPYVTVTDIHSESDRTEAFLPAWEMSYDSPLLDVPQFSAAVNGSEDASTPTVLKQTVKAAYNRNGFEAAALTGMMMRASAMMPRKAKKYSVLFNRNYVVVAHSKEEAWAKIPLFSIIVKPSICVEVEDEKEKMIN